MDIQRVYTHSTDPIESAPEEEQGHRLYRQCERDGPKRASKIDIGPNSLSLDSITFNRLAGPMLPGAE